jgi:hypothetical protein
MVRQLLEPDQRGPLHLRREPGGAGTLVFNPQLSTLIPQLAVSYTRGTDLSGTLEGAGGIGGLLARSEPSALNLQLSTAYYHADGNGNITALVNTNQVLVAKYHYDPYGNILSQSGPLAEANLYRFSSKELAPQLGARLLPVPVLRADLQRWMNRDPAEHKTIGLMLAGGLLVAGSFAKALNRKGCSGTKAPRKSQLDHAKHGNKRAEKGPQSSIT